MTAQDEFAMAAARAAAGKCPIDELPPFYTNHWDVCDLCRAFDCKVCVATLEDLGLAGHPLPEAPQGEVSWEVPF